ncbi:MAG TPA: hypothetical protein V6D29_25985 [Leptolyngbyaceae cyanobacterium]
MKMLTYLPLSGVLLIASGLIACSAPQMQSQAASSSPQTESTSTPDVATPPTSPALVGWPAILGPTSVPAGWRVEPCENPSQLCVYTNNEIVGTVELFSHPIAGSNFAPLLAEAKGERLPALNAWVTEHYATIERDRNLGAPEMKFMAEPPEEVAVGSLPGLRYSFNTNLANGSVGDRTVGYVTTDGTSLYVVAMTAADGDHSGAFSSIEAAQTFEPYLADIVAGLKL